MKFNKYIHTEAFKKLDTDYKIMVILENNKANGMDTVVEHTSKHIRNTTACDSMYAMQSASIY